MLPDYHVHTKLCKHACGEIGEYIDASIKRGMKSIAITDHAPDPSGYDAQCRMEPGEFEYYKKTVLSNRDRMEGGVLFGIEADYYEGCEKNIAPLLESNSFDLILGSVHYIGDWSFDNPDFIHIWESSDVTGVWRSYFKIIRKLVETRMFHILAHLDLPKKFGYRPPENEIAEMAKPVLDLIAEHGMVVELNTAGLRWPAREIYPSTAILAMACERGIPVCFGSDSHCPNETGHEFDKALKTAKEAGYKTAVAFKAGKAAPYPLP